MRPGRMATQRLGSEEQFFVEKVAGIIVGPVGE